jgi:two-component system, OmpR family, response regulator MprA
MPARTDSARPEVLVIDDERAMRDALTRALELGGFDVDLAEDGADGLRRAAVGSADIVVLDVMMPRTDGLEVCRRLRRRGDRIPVLMLTARDAVASRVEGLEAGADDYLVKPFALEELLARIRALLRRSGTDPPEGPPPVGDLVMDSASRIVRRGARELSLTRTEYLLLEVLMENAGRVLSREQIFDRVWGYDFGPRSKALEVYIGYLRRETRRSRT